MTNRTGHGYGWTGTEWVPIKLDAEGRMVIDQPVGGGGDADIVWATTPTLVERPSIRPKLPDALIASDSFFETLRLQSPVRLSSTRIVPAIQAAYPEDLSLPSGILGRASDVNVGRSGTPDTDMLGDAWVDGVLANQGVNHGNETPLQVADQAILVTEKDAFMAWDLTRFANCTAPVGGTMVLEIWAGHGIAAGVNGSAIFSKKGTNPAVRPFTESTLTWTNRPAVGTDVVTKTFISAFISIGAPATQTLLTLTAAEYGPYLGGWLMVRFTADALALSPLNIVSREGATTTERPRLSFDFRRV